MKSKFLTWILLTFSLLLALFAFGGGYYRGYLDRSRILTSFQLALDEGNFVNAQAQPPMLRENLKVAIYCESKSLEALETSPFNEFAEEFSQSKAGDISKSLAKARQITQGMVFSPMVFPPYPAKNNE